MFENKVLLITGGTGSFGNAVLERVLSQPFSEIRIFSRDEKKQEDMRITLKNERLKFYIGDVRNESSLRDAMSGVDLSVRRHTCTLPAAPLPGPGACRAIRDCEAVAIVLAPARACTRPGGRNPPAFPWAPPFYFHALVRIDSM